MKVLIVAVLCISLMFYAGEAFSEAKTSSRIISRES